MHGEDFTHYQFGLRHPDGYVELLPAGPWKRLFRAYMGTRRQQQLVVRTVRGRNPVLAGGLLQGVVLRMKSGSPVEVQERSDWREPADSDFRHF